MREPAANGTNAEHYTKLEHMYMTAPINAFYSPRIRISHGETVITIPVKPEFFHAAEAVHGSVYFKLLDDAAFFSVNSLIEEYFALTASFTTYLLRPISEGTMKATGKVVYAGARSFIADAVVVDGDDNEIARGSGNFVISKIKLTADMGYRV
ncbi:MAG: PaaI family thioesterase [Acidobacteriaceae bacterium]|nr:PaaI family thioesterase [Acidobacteriaceae bacterium]